MILKPLWDKFGAVRKKAIKKITLAACGFTISLVCYPAQAQSIEQAQNMTPTYQKMGQSILIGFVLTLKFNAIIYSATNQLA